MLRTTSTNWIFSASNSFKKKHAPPSDLLKLYTNTKGTFETRHSLQKCTRCTHNDKVERRDTNMPRPANPLLSCRSPSTVRERQVVAWQNASRKHPSMTRPHAFPGTTCAWPKLWPCQWSASWWVSQGRPKSKKKGRKKIVKTRRG